MLEADKEKTVSSLKTVAADYSSTEQLNYFDMLHFSPLKVLFLLMVHLFLIIIGSVTCS